MDFQVDGLLIANYMEVSQQLISDCKKKKLQLIF